MSKHSFFLFTLKFKTDQNLTTKFYNKVIDLIIEKKYCNNLFKISINSIILNKLKPLIINIYIL